MKKQPELSDIPPDIMEFFREHEEEPTHPIQVMYLAEELFDQLKDLHRMGDTERQYVRYASLLHDIGVRSADLPHHKVSMNLILQDTMMHLTNEERMIIALLARYHRKAIPSERQPAFACLSKKNKKRVTYAAAIIRIADALDRTHQARIQGIRCEISPGKVLIICRSSSPLDAEAAALITKGYLFTELTGREVILDW